MRLRRAGEAASLQARGINNAHRGSGQSKRRPRGPNPTHFLCIPLVTNASRASLEAGIVTLQKALREHGVPDSPVKPLGTVHVTIGVMSLQSEERLQAACQLLKSLDVDELLRLAATTQEADKYEASHDASALPWEPAAAVMGTANMQEPATRGNVTASSIAPLKVSLQSLYSMRDAKSTNILYALPQPAAPLEVLCQQLRDVFDQGGFTGHDGQSFKLHATLFHGYKKVWIDARALLEACKDKIWSDVFELEKVAICRMSAKPVVDVSGRPDKEYTEVCSVPLQTAKASVSKVNLSDL